MTKSALNPQGEQMADESMIRTLAAQVEAIWPQEKKLIDFYRLPRNSDRIRLAKRAWQPPATYPMGKSEKEGRLVPMRANESVSWQLVS